MKLSWKLFFIITPLFVLFLTVFGTWIIQDSFQNSLDQEIERCMVENQTFQNSYELTRNALSEEQWEQTSLKKVIESFHKKQEEGSGNARMYDVNGAILYQDNPLDVPSQLCSRLDEENNVGYEIVTWKENVYVAVVCRSGFDDYIETVRNITNVYRMRDSMYAKYQVGMIVLTILVGGIILTLLFLVMRNVQSLSHAAREFAAGRYDTRVKIRSSDEIGHLAEDFNWMADEMSRQMTQLEEEVRRQEEFTAAFAHELKTPLTSIIGYADTIRQMELTKEETDMCADYIFQQGKRLQNLSYKLLEMTMAGEEKLERSMLSVPELLQETARTAAVSLKEKQLHLQVNADNGFIFGDWELLTSLFLNLIDNARKASEPGKRIWLTGTQQRTGYQISVRDEGRGIEPEELTRITEAFYMVDKSRSRKEGGAGLGLALGKKIVELHEASWRFSGKPGEGFTVTILFWEQNKPKRMRGTQSKQRRRRERV